MIFLVLLLGLTLRVYGFPGNFIFEGELGRELLYLRQYSLLNQLPLIGMTTSHEWLHYGPFYYWIVMPIFKIFNGNPFILFWSAVSFFGIGLFLNFLAVRKIVNEKVALFSCLIQSVSPFLIEQTKLSKLHTFFFVLSPVLMYCLYRLWNGDKRFLFWSGLIFGLMFSFHFSQIPFVLVFVLLFWIKRKHYGFIDWLKFSTGMLLSNITYFFQDLKIFAWLPYRALSITDKNPPETFNAFLEFFGSNLFWNNAIWIIGLIIFVTIFAHYIWRSRKDFTKEFLPFYLISTIGVMLIANIIHGTFPIHYFLPIFTIVPVLYAVYLAKIKWGILIIVLLVGVNFKGYFNTAPASGFVSYSKQLEAAGFIVFDAKGTHFSIKRFGPYDYFPENYSQNYKYLVLWKGGNLVENSPNVYKIVEGNGNISVQR